MDRKSWRRDKRIIDIHLDELGRKEIKEKSALPKQNLVRTRPALRLMGIKEGTGTRKIRVMGTIATESRVVPLGCLLKDRRFTGVQHPGGVKVIPSQTNGFTYS